jgi:hypothetical protein
VFIPTDPGEIQADPEGTAEFPEPNPDKEPEIEEPDTDKENEEEEQND